MIWPSFPKRLQSARKAPRALAQSEREVQPRQIAARIGASYAETAKTPPSLVTRGFVTSRRGTKGECRRASVAGRIATVEVFFAKHAIEPEEHPPVRNLQDSIAPCQKAFGKLSLADVAQTHETTRHGKTSATFSRVQSTGMRPKKATREYAKEERMRSQLSQFFRGSFPRLASFLCVTLFGAHLALAVPSYSRQTGLPCSSCHYVPPELNAFGRKFKLEGYTFATKPEVTEDKKGHNSGLNLLEVLPLSVVFDTSFTATKAPQPGTQNGNFEFPQAVSLFLAGAWGSHVGSFAQVTYDAQADHFSWDNTDIRAAGTNGKLFGKQLTYGLTMNNNPTVEDLWNSTPAWGFPFVSTDVAPSPTAGAIINGALAQDVAGLGGYAMWNDHLYFAGTVYRSEHLGASQPNDGTCCSFNIRGMAPYWRLAYQATHGNHDFMIGSYGMHMKSTPGAITGAEDGYTDWAGDFQYNLTIPQWKDDVVSVRGTYIRENSSLVASAAAVPAAAGFVGHHLNTVQGEAEYHFGTRVATTAGLFSMTGTADPTLYPEGAVTGNLNGSPTSRGYIFNVAWWPQQNIGLTAQYTGYTRFNGGSTNYDQAGRNANGNNSIYLMARFVF